MARTVKVRRTLLQQAKEILETDSDSDAINVALDRVVRGRKAADLLKRINQLPVHEIQEVWDREAPEAFRSA